MKNIFGYYWAKKTIIISIILFKEHIREPATFIWTTLSPTAVFILLALSRNPKNTESIHYITSASWFYAYISFSVTFFGLSFYLIGRRESGFVRSFVYRKTAVSSFLFSHVISYLLLGLLQVTTFYLITKPLHGNYNTTELYRILQHFLISFLFFLGPALLLTTLAIRFSTASTVLSMASFLMLFMGYLGTVHADSSAATLLGINPLTLNAELFKHNALTLAQWLKAVSAAVGGALITYQFFRVQPVWSRY